MGMKRKFWAVCLIILMAMSLLCACGKSSDDDIDLRQTVKIFDESGTEIGYFDFIYDNSRIVGVNQCDNNGHIFLCGSDLEFDSFGNITHVTFSREDGTVEKEFRWKFADEISPHALNFYENLVNTYFDERTSIPPMYPAQPGVIIYDPSSPESFIMYPAQPGVIIYDPSSPGANGFPVQIPTNIPSGLQEFSVSSDMFFASPVDRVNMSLCDDTSDHSAFDTITPYDVTEADVIHGSYIASVADGNGRIIAIHQYVSYYSTYASITHILFTYDQDGRIAELISASWFTQKTGNFSYARVVPTYGDDGVIVSAQAFSKSGKLVGEAGFENGMIALSKFYDDNGTYVCYVYSNGEIVSTTEYDEFGNEIFEDNLMSENSN